MCRHCNVDGHQLTVSAFSHVWIHCTDCRTRLSQLGEGAGDGCKATRRSVEVGPAPDVQGCGRRGGSVGRMKEVRLEVLSKEQLHFSFENHHQ